MSKHATSVLAGFALLLWGNVAHAAPISSCIQSSGLYQCNFYETDITGNPVDYATLYPALYGLLDPGWLTGYTFILQPGTLYSGIADNGNISNVVYIHDTHLELFSVGYLNFASIVANALAAIGQRQVVGTPFFDGAGQLPICVNSLEHCIGLVNEDNLGAAHLEDLIFNGGQGDSIWIYSDLVVEGPPVEPPVEGVPEPSTLSLLSIGALGVAFRRRSNPVGRPTTA